MCRKKKIKGKMRILGNVFNNGSDLIIAIGPSSRDLYDLTQRIFLAEIFLSGFFSEHNRVRIIHRGSEVALNSLISENIKESRISKLNIVFAENYRIAYLLF